MQEATDKQISNVLVQPCRKLCVRIRVCVQRQGITVISGVLINGGFSDNRIGLEFLLV